MRPLKGVPLSREEEKAICTDCGGFCCKYFFFNPQDSGNNDELHKFRQRKFVRYGNCDALILTDICPYTSDELKSCTQHDNPKFPTLCREFPSLYRPFWNLKCKLMRVRYARRLISKHHEGFSNIKTRLKKQKSVFRVY